MSQARPVAGSSHQSSTGQATGSGNQTNTLYSTEDTSAMETRHFPIIYEESWDKVTVEIQIQENSLFINYLENDIRPFEVQYMCSVADLKNSVDVLSDRFALEEIKNNVIVAKLKFGGQAVPDLKKRFFDILKNACEEYLSLPVAEKDFCLLEDYASKSPEVRYYRHKSQMYICGKKTSINGIKTKLEYPRGEVQIGKDAMLLFQEYNYFKHQRFGGVTIVPMNEEMVVCSCSYRKRVKEAVNILREEKSQVTSSLTQGVHISEDMKQKLKNKHVMVEVSETDEVKLIFRKNQKPEIDKILHQLVSSHTQENQQTNNYEGIKSTNALQNDDAQVPELPKETRTYMQDEVWTCDSGLCSYFKKHGINIIENLETEQNVSIEIGEDQIKFTGNKDNIHISVLSLKWHMMSNSLIVPNDRGNLCQWATTPAGKKVLGQITDSHDCGWTLVPVSPLDDSTPKRKGVLPLATWTLTTPRQKNHHLSVCVVEDFGQTDLKEIIIPVFTDQTPLHKVATMQLGEFTNSHVRKMKNGELIRKRTKTPDRNIMLVALAEKVKDNQSETMTVPDSMALQEYFHDMFRDMHKQTEAIAFVVPKSSYLKEWKLLMQSLVVAFQGEFQNIFSDTLEILLCCQHRSEALRLLDVVHNLCCKNMLGTFDTSTPVVMSKRICLKVIQTSLFKLQVDCIVVMVSRDLDLSKGPIPTQLSNEVGPELQKCIKDLKTYHLTDGQCFFLQLPKPLTSGIKSVIFGYLPKWQNKGHLETFRQFIRSCLHTAAIRECSSLGFPAIGTGYLGYSQRSVTRIMFDTVEQFSHEAMCASLERVMVAIVDQNDLMWKMMTWEEERRKNMAQNGLKKCQAIPYLEKKMKNGLYVKVVAKESLLCPLSSDWVLVEFKCKKEKDQPFVINFCLICCESETNDRVEVYCLDSGKNLKDQMKEVFSWCENQRKIDCLAINCSHSFSLPVACQVKYIIEALQDTRTSSICNVLIITPDESGLQDAEQVLHKDDTALTKIIGKFSMTKQSVWQKKPAEPCHMLVLFGQGKQIAKAVSSIQQKHPRMLASNLLEEANKSDNVSSSSKREQPSLADKTVYIDNSEKLQHGCHDDDGQVSGTIPPVQGVPKAHGLNQVTSGTSGNPSVELSQNGGCGDDDQVSGALPPVRGVPKNRTSNILTPSISR